ncbi:MAG: hypothetical protein R2827_08665 [Bdellovibrionales bacterium]
MRNWRNEAKSRLTVRFLIKHPRRLMSSLNPLGGEYSSKDIETIKKCYEFSEKAHKGQVRAVVSPIFPTR